MNQIQNQIGSSMVSSFKDRMSAIKRNRNQSAFIATKDLHSVVSMDDEGHDAMSPHSTKNQGKE